MDINEQDYLDELWWQFRVKIESEWALKYADFGSGLDDITSPYLFSAALLEDINETRAERQFRSHQRTINQSTLDRIIKAEGLSITLHSKTREVLLEYLGYSHIWQEFKLANRARIEAKERQDYHTNQHQPWRIFIGKYGKKIAVLLLGVFVVLLFLNRQEERKNTVRMEQFKTLIRWANEIEFELSRTPPDSVYITLLDSVFTEKGSARIRKTVENLRTKPRRFSEQESYVNPLLDFVFLSEKDGIIRIQTEEEWMQVWYDTETDQRLAYPTSGRQIYYLKKEDGRWKIDSYAKVD
ncbi:MAG: hypothetical protein AAFY36_10605 [Bacteroidota bacterium]